MRSEAEFLGPTFRYAMWDWASFLTSLSFHYVNEGTDLEYLKIVSKAQAYSSLPLLLIISGPFFKRHPSFQTDIGLWPHFHLLMSKLEKEVM